jgi:hypothetical protein
MDPGMHLTGNEREEWRLSQLLFATVPMVLMGTLFVFGSIWGEVPPPKDFLVGTGELTELPDGFATLEEVNAHLKIREFWIRSICGALGGFSILVSLVNLAVLLTERKKLRQQFEAGSAPEEDG